MWKQLLALTLSACIPPCDAWCSRNPLIPTHDAHISSTIGGYTVAAAFPGWHHEAPMGAVGEPKEWCEALEKQRLRLARPPGAGKSRNLPNIAIDKERLIG